MHLLLCYIPYFYFFSAFAHDIRTPLTVMKGYTEFLLKYVPQGKVSEEDLTEKLEIICKNQNRLLEFSKTMTEIQTMGMRLLHCKWCHFTNLVDNIARTAKELESQNGIAVQVTIVEESFIKAFTFCESYNFFIRLNIIFFFTFLNFTSKIHSYCK